MSNRGGMRIEHDLPGNREVPAEAYYGVHTLHPNEHGNIRQGTNDVYPLAIKLALQFYVDELLRSMARLHLGRVKGLYCPSPGLADSTRSTRRTRRTGRPESWANGLAIDFRYPYASVLNISLAPRCVHRA